jgi:DNA modification methylase
LAGIIVREDRYRREFDEGALSELGEDIVEHGLYHAVVIRETPNGPELVAGERRYKAIASLYEFGVQFKYDNRPVPLDLVPTVTLGTIEELESRAIQALENIAREDFTWQERELAIADLHKLRESQALQAGSSQTLAATAAEIASRAPREASALATPADYLGSAQVRRALTIAEHLSDPLVAAAKTPTEALKVIERKQTTAHNEKLAALVGAKPLTARHTIRQGKAEQILAEFEAASFDVILTDPPYGIGAQSFGEQADIEHNYDDTPETWRALMQALAPQWFRLAKPQAHAYVFCDLRRFNELSGFMQLAGFETWPLPLLWIKNGGMLPRPEHGPRRTYEAILYAIKGGRKVTGVYSDTLIFPMETNKVHAAQKPVALYCSLLARSVKPGDKVLDSCCGSGTIFPAANRMHVYATGIELSAAAYGTAYARMEEL